MTNAKNIKINSQHTTEEEEEILLQIKISDDCVGGFINILSSGEQNPLNLTHLNEKHSDDTYSGQFGTGTKCAFINASNICTLYTFVDNVLL